MSRYTHWGWIILLALALMLRLAALDAVPLAPDEAASALASLDAARGAGWPASVESPLLLVGNALLFTFFGGGDGIARLLPALVGIALVGLPYFWRKHLGEIGALSAAGLLLVSPLVLFASRRLESATIGVLGAGLLLTALLTDDESSESGRVMPWLTGFGIAIGLTGGPSFYDALLSGVIAWALFRWMRGLPALPSLRRWRVPVAGGVAAAVLISIGFGLRWNGWGGIGEGLASWLVSWRGDHQGISDVVSLLLYEPVTFLLACFGLALMARKKQQFAMVLAAWGFIGLVLVSLRPGATPLALGAAVLPLALLAGSAVQHIVTGVDGRHLWWIGGQALVSFVFWQPVGLALAGHSNATTYALWIVILGAVTLLALQALIALLFSLSMPLAEVWRGAILGIGLAMLVVQFGFAWGLAFVRPTSPAEPAVIVAGSPDLRALRRSLDEMAVQRGQRRDTFEITLVADDVETASTVRWVLRDFPRLRVVNGWPADVSGVVVATPDAAPAATTGVAWEGMRFIATTRSAQAVPICQSLSPPSCSELAGWYLYRKPKFPLVPGEVILWAVP